MKNYHIVSSLKKLEELLGTDYDIPNREAFSEYIFQHPLRFTPYLLKQIKQFPSIAKQYLPDPKELNPVGKKKPLTGLMKTGIAGLERLYLDRVILMPSSQCFAYCRFCFRKNYSHDIRNGDYGNIQQDFKDALAYIRNDSRIKEVLITGGDPLMFPEKVLEIIHELRKIPHLTGIRIGTRIFTSDPELITKEWIKPFQELNTLENSTLNIENFQIPAGISISPHINHPDELSPETVRALLLCTQNNIPLYNQTVMLKGVNDSPQTLLELCRKLRQLNVEPYRVYHADPLEGSEHFRTTLQTFMNIKRWLRSHASGRVVPSFIVDTTLGKIELGADADIIKREGRTIWIRTPYTRELFRSVIPDWQAPTHCQVDNEGYLIVEHQDSLESQTKEEDQTIVTLLQIENVN